LARPEGGEKGVLINTLPLLEAQASSGIEKIVTKADRFFSSPKAMEARMRPPNFGVGLGSVLDFTNIVIIE